MNSALFLFLGLFCVCAFAAPQTLTIDMRPAGNGGILRALPDCQWIEPDLTEQLVPDLTNVGTGTVIRVKNEIQIKLFSEAQGKAVWTPFHFLPSYRDNGILERYASLREHYGKKDVFYETAGNIEKTLAANKGFRLEPGTLVVATGDPAFVRSLFGATILEFIVLQSEVIDGTVVYRPRGLRGSISFESIARSAVTIFKTSDLTMTAERKSRKLEKTSKSDCKNFFEQRSECSVRTVRA